MEGEEQPPGSSLWSESEPPAQNARSLARSPPRERGAGVGGEPWPFAPLLWFVGGGARERGKENIHRASTGELALSCTKHLGGAGNWHRGRGEGAEGEGMPLKEKINTFLLIDVTTE